MGSSLRLWSSCSSFGPRMDRVYLLEQGGCMENISRLLVLGLEYTFYKPWHPLFDA